MSQFQTRDALLEEMQALLDAGKILVDCMRTDPEGFVFLTAAYLFINRRFSEVDQKFNDQVEVLR